MKIKNPNAPKPIAKYNMPKLEVMYSFAAPTHALPVSGKKMSGNVTPNSNTNEPIKVGQSISFVFNRHHSISTMSHVTLTIFPQALTPKTKKHEVCSTSCCRILFFLSEPSGDRCDLFVFFNDVRRHRALTVSNDVFNLFCRQTSTDLLE